MKALMEKLEHLLEWGGIKKDIILLAVSAAAVLCSLFGLQPLPFDMAWFAIILCGVPIILEAVIGLVTAFDIKADVLVSLALIASVCIGEDFAAGEVAVIMQLGGLLEELTVAKARAGIEKLVHLTPQTARLLPDLDEAALTRLAAAAEQLSEHPLGRAVVRCCRGDAPLPPAEHFEMLPGQGVAAHVEGKTVLAGNPQLLAARHIPMTTPPETEALLGQGCTVIYLAVEGAFAGYIALSDTLREESAGMISALTALGVQPVLLTGDHENAARTIAGKLRISQVRAGCLPQDKLAAIDEYQNSGSPVCMIGDGINDAPALRRAAVGIAMGGIGSDIAVDAADIALIDDEVKELPHLLALSRRMMTTIKLNMSFSMALNFLAIILAIIGSIDPVVGALVHNAGSVLVITNSALLLNWRKK